MTESAIPVQHSFLDETNFLQPPDDSATQDQAVAALAGEAGWLILENKIKTEIARLSKLAKEPGETMEEFGFRVYAAQLTCAHLEWVISDVRGTERSVGEREQA